jgi:HEAT repeat protein
MKIPRLFALAFALLFAGSIPTLDAAQPRPPLDIFISAGDSWWFGAWLPVDSPESIKQTVQMWHDVLNTKRVYWRGQQVEMLLDDNLLRPENLQYHEFYAQWGRVLTKEYKLNQVLAAEAKRQGLEVYLWFPLFDFGGPPDHGGTKEFPYYTQSKLTLEHPEWMPVDRYGMRRQNGPIEMAYPEARRALINILVRYLDRDDLAGVMFFTYSENYGLRFDDEYGFNQPIVDEYKKRYGVDIRTQEFDRNLWRYLRGEYVTQFLRELKEALRTRGRKVGVRLNPVEPNYPDRWNVPLYFPTAGHIYLDWERWVREGIVDDLAINGTAPAELQYRTVENVLAATKGTPIQVSMLTGRPAAERMQPYRAQGLRTLLFATDEASYIKHSYGEQTAAALSGADPYAAIRFLAQINEGQATVPLAQIEPLLASPNILVRRQAVKAVGKLKDPRGIPALEKALDDPERAIRSTAAFAFQDLSGPQSVARLIATVRRYGEFPIFESAASTLTVIDERYLPEIIALSRDSEVRMRRLAAYALGRRGDARGLPALIAAMRDEDVFVRFRAANGLLNFPTHPEAIEALIRGLSDSSEIIQNRAAISLAVALVPGSTTPPRLGLESSIKTLATPVGPLRTIALNPAQERGLTELVKVFRRFADGSTRKDLDWGFRPVGNAILAFGAEGGRRLQSMIDQKTDRQLADRAWQVLNIRQGMENFVPVPGADEVNAGIYSTYPNRTIETVLKPSNLKYDPTDK